MNEFNNNNFYGKLKGKSIRNFYKLDYSIIRSDNRVKYAKDLLGAYQIGDKEFYDEFFEELFDTTERQKIKIHLSKDDSIYSTSNIAIYLERIGSYILNSKEQIVDGEVQQKKELKYKIYNSKELFNRACQEDKFINDMTNINGGKALIDNPKYCQGEAFPIFQATEKNYNKVKRIKFEGKKDADKHPVLKDYLEFYNHLKDKLKQDDATRMLSDVLHGVKDDLNNGKMLLENPIIFKSPLTPSPTSIYTDWDIPNEKEIRHLLQIEYDSLIDTDMICAVMDLNDIVDKCTFTQNQRNVLNLYRRCVQTNQISEILGMAKCQVSSTINSICRIIESKYWEEYEERYRVFVVKSTWKKCDRCGEIKFIQSFSTNGKQGYINVCKKCRRKH